MKKGNLRWIALCGGLLASLSAVAQPASKDSDPLPLDKAVRTGKLANGFTYFIRHNQVPKNRVTLYLVNKVGSVLETDEEQGLAHFMEHMSFNGTKHFPKSELVNYLQKSGVRFGADLNAVTSFDETIYQLPLPTDQPDILKNGIQIMRDWAQEATLDPVEIDKERGVVLEEKRLRKGAGDRMQKQFLPVMFNHSKYASRLPIGTDEVLNSFKPETIKSFYKNWYRPNLQALIVVGDIDVDQMEQTIKAKFGDLKNPANEKPRTQYSIPLTGKNQFIAVTDKEQTSTSLQVIIKSRSAESTTAADYRNMVLRSLYNSMLGQRYRELSVKSNTDFLSGGAQLGEMIADVDQFEVSIIAKPGELERGVKAVWREIERLKRFGFTAAEFERAKISYISSMESAQKEKDKTTSGSYVSEYTQYFLKGVFAPGIDKEVELIREILPKVTLADFNVITLQYIKPTDRDLLIMAPEKDKNSLPDETRVNSWLADVAKEDLKPYQEQAKGESLLAAGPIPGKIVAEQKDEKLNTTTLTLSNGLKVVLKPTDFKNNEINFTGFSRGGTSLYSNADYQSASRSASIVAASGAGKMSMMQLGQYFNGKVASSSPYINERSQGFNGRAQPKDLELALQLTYAYFTAPRKDAEMFSTLINKNKDALIIKANDPGPVFQDTLQAVLSNYNIRRTSVTLAKLEQVKLDRALEIYKERFADASAFTFVFIGSFNTDSIKPLLEKYLGSLPATHKNEKAVDLNIHPADGRIEKTVYKGTEQKAGVSLIFHGPYQFSQENNINMNALKEALQIRMIERLRESESGAYSPSVGFSAGRNPERFMISVNFGCSPQNVDKLIASVLDEVEKLKASGPPQVNLDKFKAEDTRSVELNLRSNSFWMNYLIDRLMGEEDLHAIFNYNKALEKVTTQTVQAKAKEYLTGKNYIRMVLMPEKESKTK